MEEQRVRVLLREERQRLERLLASVDADHDRVTRVDEVAGDLAAGADRRIGEETDEAVARQLNQRMEALQRAEGRLAAGTYGRSGPERPADPRRAAGGVPTGRADR